MRPIDADALYERLVERYRFSSRDAHIAYRNAIDDVCDAPTIEVEPVKHAKWEERPAIVGAGTTGLFCTGCGYPANGWRHKHCPDCGAKMDLED